MTRAKDLPSQDELRRLFDYRPETGELIWRKRDDRDSQWNGRRAGRRAGYKHKGYYRLKIGSEPYAAHRVVWKLAYGSIPNDMQIDHIDGNGMNNRLDNLRLVTNLQNQLNRKADSGRRYKGVYQHRGRFKAEITYEGTRIYCGLFPTERIAAFAYDETARDLHGEHASLNFPEIQEAS